MAVKYARCTTLIVSVNTWWCLAFRFVGIHKNQDLLTFNSSAGTTVSFGCSKALGVSPLPHNMVAAMSVDEVLRGGEWVYPHTNTGNINISIWFELVLVSGIMLSWTYETLRRNLSTKTAKHIHGQRDAR